MTTSFWLAFAAYLIPTFPLGYFWHLKTFAGEYEKLEIYRPDVIIPMGLGSMVIQAIFFAWAYPKLFSAVQAALVFGVLAWSFLVLPSAAKYRMKSVGRFVALESAFTALQFGVTAPLIALAWRGASPA